MNRVAPKLEFDTQIGQKLRQRRLILRKSLQEVADQAQVSGGLLSQIERSISTPSLKSLQQICAALNMPVSWLFEHSSDGQDHIVVRSRSRRRLDLGPKGMLKELMTPDTVPAIQMMRIIIRPDGGSGDQPYRNESGAKCGVILTGTLGLEVNGEQYVLNAGDSFAFSATDLHRFWCIGQQEVDLFWIVTPAIY